MAHQAESVSRRLGVPVLIHPQPKPGCAKDIINYFSGDLELHSLSDRRQVKLLDRAIEREIESVVEQDFVDKVEAGETLLGRPRGSSADLGGRRPTSDRRLARTTTVETPRKQLDRPISIARGTPPSRIDHHDRVVQVSRRQATSMARVAVESDRTSIDGRRTRSTSWLGDVSIGSIVGGEGCRDRGVGR